MKEVVEKYVVYSFNELPSDIQQKIIEKHREINVEDEWYNDTIENQIEEINEEIGVSAPVDAIDFDLGRGSNIGAKNGEIEFDLEKILKDINKKVLENYNNGKLIIEISSLAPTKKSGRFHREFPREEWKDSDFSLCFEVNVSDNEEIDDKIKDISTESVSIQKLPELADKLTEIIKEMEAAAGDKVLEIFEQSLPFIKKGIELIEDEDDNEYEMDGESLFDENYHKILTIHEEYIKTIIVDLIQNAYNEFVSKLGELYKTLQEEYTHLMSNEAVQETIEANEWNFDITGKMRNA